MLIEKKYNFNSLFYFYLKIYRNGKILEIAHQYLLVKWLKSYVQLNIWLK